MGWFGNKDNNEDKELVDRLSKKNALTGIFSKKNRRIGSVFLYERIGKNEIFKGSYPLIKGIIKDLGEYNIIDIDGKNVFLNVPHYNDFTQSDNPKIGKILEVVKFAEDDYRVRPKLTEEYSAEKLVPEMITKEVCVICDKFWDVCSCKVKDEENMTIVKIQKKGKDGKPILVKKTVKWEEPKGVTQEGRDSIRSMNNYIKRMEEHRKKEQGFWDKYGAMITIIVAMFLSVGLTGYIVNKDIKAMNYAVDAFANTTKEIQNNVKWWENANIIKNIGQAMTESKDEKIAPPT
jgi:hypothetical protein